MRNFVFIYTYIGWLVNYWLLECYIGTDRRLYGKESKFMRVTWVGWGARGGGGPDSVHLWVTFSIQNVALRVSRRKTSKMFP